MPKEHCTFEVQGISLGTHSAIADSQMQQHTVSTDLLSPLGGISGRSTAYHCLIGLGNLFAVSRLALLMIYTLDRMQPATWIGCNHTVRFAQVLGRQCHKYSARSKEIQVNSKQNRSTFGS